MRSNQTTELIAFSHNQHELESYVSEIMNRVSTKGATLSGPHCEPKLNRGMFVNTVLFLAFPEEDEFTQEQSARWVIDAVSETGDISVLIDQFESGGQIHCKRLIAKDARAMKILSSVSLPGDVSVVNSTNFAEPMAAAENSPFSFNPSQDYKTTPPAYEELLGDLGVK